MRRGDTDSERNYFRSGARVFNLNGSWYFATREGDRGPFLNRNFADQEAARYADERVTLCSFQESRESGRLVRRSIRENLSILPKDETAPRHRILALGSD